VFVGEVRVLAGERRRKRGVIVRLQVLNDLLAWIVLESGQEPMWPFVRVRLVALPPDDSYDDVQVFATNLDVDDEIGLDRRRTKKQIERYNRRGGIENAYKKIKAFGAWTTKMDIDVRLFHFGWAVILYALWLLVDFLVKLSLDLEYEVEPRLKANRFRDLFGRWFRKLI
jgi:IS4 transposase